MIYLEIYDVHCWRAITAMTTWHTVCISQKDKNLLFSCVCRYFKTSSHVGKNWLLCSEAAMLARTEYSVVGTVGYWKEQWGGRRCFVGVQLRMFSSCIKLVVSRPASTDGRKPCNNAMAIKSTVSTFPPLGYRPTPINTLLAVRWRLC